MNPADFANLIAGLECNGISRSEIARRAGVSRTTVWRMAAGEASQPSYEAVRRIQKLASSVTKKA